MSMLNTVYIYVYPEEKKKEKKFVFFVVDTTGKNLSIFKPFFPVHSAMNRCNVSSLMLHNSHGVLLLKSQHWMKAVPQRPGRSAAVKAAAGSQWKTAVCRTTQNKQYYYL